MHGNLENQQVVGNPVLNNDEYYHRRVFLGEIAPSPPGILIFLYKLCALSISLNIFIYFLRLK